MTYKTHINFGILFAILLVNSLYLEKYQAIVFIIISAFTSLLPDVDHKKSFISNKFYLILGIIIIMFLAFEYNLYILLFILTWFLISRFLKHRTFSHSIIGMLMFCLPFYNTQYFIPVLIGYASHLFADMITIEGIPLFFPFCKERIHILNFKVRSFSEMILLTILIIVNVLLFIAKVIPLFA